VDLAGAECGCNVAVYLSAMNQNRQVGTCGDYYCDSNHICGVACSEIHIQEANQHAWHSSLDATDDGKNVGCGLGGDVVPNCSWSPADYGVGGRCVDTTQPFHVAASFPVNSMGRLKGIHVKLSQPGKSCNVVTRMDSYIDKGVDDMLEMTKAVAAGMTPVVSYWSSTNMLWMDGTGMSKKGYCTFETPDICNTAAKVYGFAVEDISQQPQPVCERCPVGHCDQSLHGECMWYAGKGFEGIESYHCRVASCDEVPRGLNISSCWKWQDKSYYSINFTDYPCLADPIPQLSSAVLQVVQKLDAKPPIPTALSTAAGIPVVAFLASPGSIVREVLQRCRRNRDVKALDEHLMDSWGLALGGAFMLLLLRVKLHRRSLISAGRYTDLSTDVEFAPESFLDVPQRSNGAVSRELSVDMAFGSPPPSARSFSLEHVNNQATALQEQHQASPETELKNAL